MKFGFIPARTEVEGIIIGDELYLFYNDRFMQFNAANLKNFAIPIVWREEWANFNPQKNRYRSGEVKFGSLVDWFKKEPRDYRSLPTREAITFETYHPIYKEPKKVFTEAQLADKIQMKGRPMIYEKSGGGDAEAETSYRHSDWSNVDLSTSQDLKTDLRDSKGLNKASLPLIGIALLALVFFGGKIK